MRKVFVFIGLLLFCSCKDEIKREIVSTKKNITVLINGRKVAWQISPQVNPDILKVYCKHKINEVIFQTDIDTANFYVRNMDTLSFRVVLNHKDTAYTEIVGVKDLTDEIAENEKIYWFSQLWSEMKYNFVNMDQLDFDIDSLYKQYIAKIKNSETDYEYYQLLKQFAARFNDGHTAVWDNSQFYVYQDYFKATLIDVNHKVYIALVRKCVENDSTWVGAEVVRISGIETKEYLKDSIFPYVSASTDQHLWMQGVYKIHQDFKWKDFYATIVKRNGDTVDICLPRNGELTRTLEDEYWGMPIPMRKGIVEYKNLRDNISYINIRSFQPGNIVINKLNEYLEDIYKSNGLIIDLRNNGGGSTEVAWYLQSLLSKEKYFLNFAWETRINDGIKKANSNWKDQYKGYFNNTETRFVEPDTIFVADSIKQINIPVVILIGRYTFSAAEDFLVNMYEIPGRPLFIGQETGGSTGSPLVIQGLPKEGIGRICTRRVCFPYSHKPFVNQGIVPDVEIKEDIDDIINGTDIVLEKAIKLLGDKFS